MGYKKGFTLIELLIVIAILAILAAAVLIVINPAELLRRSRDSKRITDLDTVKNAINLYLADRGSLADLSNGEGTVAGGINARCKTATTTPTVFYSLSSWASCTTPTLGFTYCAFAGSPPAQKPDGTGWIPIKFTAVAGGTSPVSVEPIDPSNTQNSTTDLYYTYTCDSSDMTFEINANMESAAFKSGGPNDVESKDGGQITTIYEVGTKLTILTATGTYFYPTQ